MPAPRKNQNAAKPAAEKRTAPAIYLRPTEEERRIILRWAAGGKLSQKCLAAVLAAAARGD